MTKQQKNIIKNWLESAEEDYQTALSLFKLKHYGWSLFLFHLSIEKILKSYLVKNGQKIILTHNLLLLADLAKIKYSSIQTKQLAEITTYNIKARYDIEKLDFYQKANKTYTTKWIANCEKIYKWLKGGL